MPLPLLRKMPITIAQTAKTGNRFVSTFVVSAHSSDERLGSGKCAGRIECSRDAWPAQ